MSTSFLLSRDKWIYHNLTLLPVCSYTRTDLFSLRTKTSLLSLSTVDRLKDLNIGYHGGGGVDPIPCVSTHRISDPRSGPAQLLPHTSSSAATPTGSVHKSQTISVVGMSGQLKRCNESWFGWLQSGQFAAGWLAGSILCR